MCARAFDLFRVKQQTRAAGCKQQRIRREEQKGKQNDREEPKTVGVGVVDTLLPFDFYIRAPPTPPLVLTLATRGGRAQYIICHKYRKKKHRRGLAVTPDRCLLFVFRPFLYPLTACCWSTVLPGWCLSISFLLLPDATLLALVSLSVPPHTPTPPNTRPTNDDRRLVPEAQTHKGKEGES